MLLKPPSKIRLEDISTDNQRDIGVVASTYNDLADNLVSTVNGNLGFDNLNRQYEQIDVITNSSGLLDNPIKIKLRIKSKPIGMNIINVLSKDDVNAYPSQAPWPFFTFDDSYLILKQIIGLGNSKRWKVSLEIIGT